LPSSVARCTPEITEFDTFEDRPGSHAISEIGLGIPTKHRIYHCKDNAGGRPHVNGKLHEG